MQIDLFTVPSLTYLFFTFHVFFPEIWQKNKVSAAPSSGGSTGATMDACPPPPSSVQFLSLLYRSGTINSNTVNSKFHLIRSFFEILGRILSFHV